MGWSGSMSTSSAINTTITYTPDTTTVGAYTGSSFKAPIRGIYKFTLKGSGGKSNPDNLAFGSTGGQGGTTVGYLALAANATVYVGAGGPGSAAWVGKASGTTLSGVTKANIYFIAGAGGGGCSCTDTWNHTGYNCKLDIGGVGGGSTGGAGTTSAGSGSSGAGGTQAAGGAGGKAGAYGVGGASVSASATNYYVLSGRGGDGYYGGASGKAGAYDNGGCVGGGGGGGSGYYYADRLFAMGVTYLSSTSQGGGSSADTKGTVAVTYVAAWDGSATTTVGVGTTWSFYPTSGIAERAYTVHTFTAPVAGVYKFDLYGSGGTWTNVGSGSCSGGGKGGSTTGHLKLNYGQTVYIGVGGKQSAAFVSSSTGTKLSAVTKANVYFVAGAGGGGGSRWGEQWNMKSAAGAAGGGASGATASNGYGGTGSGVGGTQTSGYAYGVGEDGGYGNDGASYHRGDGGDGWWGGKAGAFSGGLAQGGGGGSGYINTSSITFKGTTYTNSTTQGGGAASDSTGWAIVTLMADANLPIIYNGVQIQKLIYNGTEVTSLTYNGTKLF